MKKGFTLIELLVVVLIIGVLAGVAMPQYRRSVRRAEMLEGLTNGKTLWDSIVRYKSANGRLPQYFSQLDAGMIGSEGFTSDVDSFNDGNFTYNLKPSNYLEVTSNKGGYSLQFDYPVTNSSGTSADIKCCPVAGDDTGSWLCKNVGTNTSGGSCYTIK